MGLWKSLFGAKRKMPGTTAATEKTQGPLVHVFVFDSGPVLQDEGKYVTNIIGALLPEAIGKPEVPVTFRIDERIPSQIGQGRSPDLKRAMDYRFAWMAIAATDMKLAEGIKSDKQEYTFTWEEFHSDWGNRGILYAFYKLT